MCEKNNNVPVVVPNHDRFFWRNLSIKGHSSFSKALVHVAGLVETNGTSEQSVAATCRSIHVRGESIKPKEEEEVCSK